MPERVVGVDLPGSQPNRYAITIGPGLLAQLANRVAHALGRTPRAAAVVIDTGVPESLVNAALASLEGEGVRFTTVRVTPTERGKSLDTLRDTLVAIAGAGLDRDDPVIAIGGGIVGDLAGFAAASYRRGVPVVQCPTTLLSMVDASVGGKTGVNLELEGDQLLKNMVGAFWQPTLVLADTDTLASLDNRTFRSGLAECVKHGMIAAGAGDPDLFSWTRSNSDAIANRDAGAIAELVERNVAVKARVVAGDEREAASSAKGGRALLNLGHTFAHAIETLPDLSPTAQPGDAPLHHGEAVALGLLAAVSTAVDAGLAQPELTIALRSVVTGFGLPDRVAHLPENAQLIERMGHDKKVRGGVVRFVLPMGATPGVCRVVEGLPEGSIGAGLDAIRS